MLLFRNILPMITQDKKAAQSADIGTFEENVNIYVFTCSEK